MSPTPTWRVGSPRAASSNAADAAAGDDALVHRRLDRVESLRARRGGATLVYMLRTKEKVLAGIEDEDERLAYATANEREHKPPRCVRVCAVPPSC